MGEKGSKGDGGIPGNVVGKLAQSFTVLYVACEYSKPEL